MKTIRLLLILMLPYLVAAQDTAKLESYLAKNRYALHIAKDSTLSMPNETSAFIKNTMKSKNLFVLGESARGHRWQLYNELRPALVGQFSSMNLKYFFVEWGRSNAYLFNLCTEGKFPCDTIGKYIWTGYGNELAEIRDIRKATPRFKYIGIDFEWSKGFYFAVNNLLSGVDTNTLRESKSFIRMITGSAYKKYSLKQFRKYYKEIRTSFNKNEAAIQDELPGQFETLKYFCTNLNNVSPSLDRNPAMYQNLVEDISPIDTNATYILSIGGEHTLQRRSVLHKLVNSNELKNRIVTMNVFCEEPATASGKIPGNHYFRKLKNETLRAFSRAADSDITIFDLSALPPEYSNLKKYGDLLLFVKNVYNLPVPESK